MWDDHYMLPISPSVHGEHAFQREKMGAGHAKKHLIGDS